MPRIFKNPFVLMTTIVLVGWLIIVSTNMEKYEWTGGLITSTIGATIVLAVITLAGLALGKYTIREAHLRLRIPVAAAYGIAASILGFFQIISKIDPDGKTAKLIQIIIPSGFDFASVALFYIMLFLFAYVVFPREWMKK